MEKRAGKSKYAARNTLFIVLMLLPSVALVTVFYYVPIITGLPYAFRQYNLWNVNETPFIGLDNFRALLKDAEFVQSVPNTVVWVFVSLFFQFMIGMMLAMFLKSKFRGRGLYQGLIFFPWAVSGFLIGIIWRWLYNGVYGPFNDILIRLGFVSRANTIGFLSDSSIAMKSVIVTNVWYGIAFFTIMFQAAMQGVPDELYEAAQVDGAGIIRRFFSITLPYIYPVIILTTLLRSIWIFNFADLIYSMTQGGPGGSTQILTSYMMNQIIFNNDFGKAAAVGLIVTVVLLLWTMLYLKVSKYNEAGDV
jgi:multiple sugar transport system permease protein